MKLPSLPKPLKPRIWAIAVLLALSGCGGGDDSKGQAGLQRTSAKQTPSPEETQRLLKRGAQLNAAELQAAAAQAGFPLSHPGRWPEPKGKPLPSAQAFSAVTAPLADSPRAKVQLKTLASVPVYRFFNSQTSAHFYTISETERDTVRNTLPQFSYEGMAFSVSPTAQAGLSPVYRFFNSQTGVHFYSISEEEKTHILQTLPQLNYEGIAYYASKTKIDGFTELGRFYVPAKGFHFYTSSSKEAANTNVFWTKHTNGKALPIT